MLWLVEVHNYHVLAPINLDIIEQVILKSNITHTNENQKEDWTWLIIDYI